MADEIVIRLRGSTAQLEAALNQVRTQMTQLGVQSKQVSTRMQAHNRRTAKSIDDQNRSFTLMVAKLALVAFAVQTVANIFNSSFGAILRNIDEFNLAAIGTAAAVTGITDETNRPIGDVFNQNLAAALATFEKLEIVSANFFATGQELQLAFNTLAQRGVVIREDEFQTLGKITDQIKLLTGGQNTQIQIQQELRAILDGNVRTTTAFGKALQARGVDVAQLSREVRATGSLAPFEPFLTGLDAASGAVRRTLSSVTATFSSLFNILARNIFQDTFDGVVSRITTINNLLIDNRDQIIQVGQVLLDNVFFAFQQINKVATTLFNIIGDIASSGVGQFLILVKAISLLASGPFKTFIILGAVVFQLTGSLESAADALDAFFKVFRIGLDVIEKGITALFDLNGLLTNLKLTLDGLQNISLLSKEAALEEQIASLTPEQLAGSRGQRLTRELERVRKQIIDNVAEMKQTVAQSTAEAGEKSGENFIEGLGKSFSEGLKTLNKDLDAASAELGLTSGTDRLKAQFEDLVKQAKELSKPGATEFAGTKEPIIADSRIEEAELKRSRNLLDTLLSQQDRARQGFFNQEISRIQKLAAERSITGQQAFENEFQAKQDSLRLDLTALENQKRLVKERAKEDLAIANRNLAATEGLTKLQQDQAQLKVIAILQKANTDEAAIQLQIDEAGRKQVEARLQAEKQIAIETRKVNRLLEDRAISLEQVGGITNVQRANQVATESARARQDFAAENLADPEAVAEFNAQQDRLDFFRSVQPQIDAFTKAVDETFNTLINGVVEGSFEFRDLAQTLSKDLIKSGLQDLIAQAKDAVTEGLESLFSGFSDVAAQQAAQALALGIGLLLAVLSRIGNDGEFTATGGSGGSSVTGSRQVQGIIGGDTALPIAEINNGLQEALIPTNNLLSQIERNTRSLAELNVNLDQSAIQGALSAQLNAFFQQMVLQNP